MNEFLNQIQHKSALACPFCGVPVYACDEHSKDEIFAAYEQILSRDGISDPRIVRANGIDFVVVKNSDGNDCTIIHGMAYRGAPKVKTAVVQATVKAVVIESDDDSIMAPEGLVEGIDDPSPLNVLMSWVHCAETVTDWE